MDGVTQQNAALVEQSAAAAASLEEQARQLMQAVAIFQLEQEQETAGRLSDAQPVPQLAAALSERRTRRSARRRRLEAGIQTDEKVLPGSL